jgi:amino acid adenylation domain-containing protein
MPSSGEFGFQDLTAECSVNNRLFEIFELYVTVIDTKSGLELLWHFNSDLFSETTVERWIEEYQVLLRGIADNTESTLSALQVLPDTERSVLLERWNATDRQLNPNKTVISMFEQQVTLTPEAIALEFRGNSLTYQQLKDKADQFAAYLQSIGTSPDQPIGFCLERSFDMVISLLGILKSGAAYIPIDPSFPDDRITFILQDSRAQSFITTPDIAKRFPDLKTLVIDPAEATVIQDTKKVHTTSGSHCAYVIYTSGSTGKPKGVEIRHFSLSNFLTAMRETPGMDGNDTLLAVTTISFDIAGLELLCPLTCGAKVILAEKDLSSDPLHLGSFINSRKPSIMQATPATWIMLLDSGWSEAGWMKILCGGEAMTRTLADRLLSTGAEVWNMYGPTETTIWSSVWKVIPGEDSPPVGKPIANTQFYILDSRLSPVPTGASGDLYISGIGLARGYCNRPELTSEKFISSPFSRHLHSGLENRMYKTGDIARWRNDGTVEVLGRSDFQVKIRGYRIETGEIESVLAHHPSVKECVVTDGNDNNKNKILIAYIVFHKGAETTFDDLRTTLRISLPEYMVPSRFVQLQSLPRLTNKKIDRSALPLPSREEAVSQSEIVLPSSPTEEMILSIWKEVLGSGTISVNDNFFDIGGHSLIAVQIFSRVRTVFGMEFSFQDIFSYPTISSLASRIETKTRTEVTDKIATSELTRVDRSGYVPMSQAQKRLWFLHQINPDSPAYNLVQAIRIKGNVDIVLLQRAVDNLVIRQESLQMVFRSNDGQPVISLNPETKIRIINVTGEITGYSMDAGSITDYIKIEVLKPFDIEHGPLTKVFLFSISPSEFICVFLIHHIITDGWSSGVLIKDLFRLYTNELPGKSTVLSDLQFQYIDFIINQNQEHDREKLDAQREYWLKTLGGDLPVLQMPFDFRRPEKLSQKGSELRFVIPKNITAELSYFSQKNGVTMFMTLLSGFAVLLNRYTQQEDIIIGVPVANRQHEASEDIIGFFVNTLALRLNVDISTSFENLLRNVHQVTIDAIRNQDVQFDELVRILKIHRDSRYNPVFQTMFAYQNYPVPEVKNEYISFKSEWIARGATQFDFSFFLWEEFDEIHGVIEYSIELFTHATISQMASQYITLLSTICNDSKAPSGSYKILSPEDEYRIISSWIATEKPFTQTLCIHELISLQAQKTPCAIAVVANGQSLTYKDHDVHSNKLARLMQNRGVKAEVPVGICLERTTGMVVALLAVLKAGGFYVPLDPYYPSERLKLMIEDASIDTVLSDTSASKVLPEGILKVITIDTIDVRDLDNCPLPALSTPDNAAYMIYTSGSTGKPKGVVIAHKSLVNFAISMVKNPGIDSHDIILAITTISFDISILELLVPLTTGAQVVVVSRDIAMDGTALSHCIQDSGITFMQATPGTWRLLLSCGWSGKSDLTLLCGGEPFPEDLLVELITKVKSVWNMYGPTETTIWSTLCKLHDTDTVISIGKPIDNTQIYILDKFLNPLPPKVPGELFIGGHGVARGYFNRPDLTDQKFIANPFSAIENAKMFATGDLARWLDNGTVECFGRIDSQVKIRGHRIETGEIESTTKKIPGIFNAVATVLKLSDTDSRLLLYYVTEKNISVSASDIRKYLQQYLPEYMVPQHLLEIDSIPLTPSGKTDRKQLPVPTFHSNEKFTPPSTTIEKDLIEIWQKVLGISRIGTDDNFFDIGGHSLIAVQIFNEIFKKYNIRLPLAALIEHSTVRDFSLYLEKYIDNKTVIFSKPEALDGQGPALTAETLSDKPIHGLRLGYDSQGRPTWFSPVKDQLQTFVSLNGDGLSVKMPCTPPPQKVLISTPAQKELLAHARADELATTTLNEIISIHLNEQIDRTALDSAIQGLSIIHEILRSHFSANGSELIIEPEIDLHVTRHKIEVLSAIDIKKNVASCEREMAEKRFDPFKGPLIDVTLLDSENGACIIIIGVHTAIIDRWSLYLLAHDLVRMYSSFAVLTSPCTLPSHGFSDYLMYRTTTAYAADYQKFLYYWHSRLGLPPLPNPVPSIFDSRSPHLMAYTQHSYTSTEKLTGDQLIKVKIFACKINVSLFSVLLAAFAVRLKTLSGSEDIITGVTFAGQLFSAMAETVGRMAKVLPMRMRVESGFDFTDLCRICHNLILNACSYTAAGIEEISKEMGLTQLKVQSLMETRLTFFNTFREKAGSFEPLYHYQPCRDTSARLELFVMETPVSLEFTVCGSTDFTSQEWNNLFVKELIQLIVANCLSNGNTFTSNPERTQPENEDERFITGLWREILDIQYKDMESSFYAYGGDSVSAVKLLDALSAQYNIKLPMSLLSEYCTIRALARYLRKETSTVKNETEKDTFQTGSSFRKQAMNTVVTFLRTGSLPPFFLF